MSFGNLFEAFAPSFPVELYHLVHLGVIKLEKDKLFLKLVEIIIEKGQFLEMVFEIDYTFEQIVFFELIIEKSV